MRQYPQATTEWWNICTTAVGGLGQYQFETGSLAVVRLLLSSAFTSRD